MLLNESTLIQFNSYRFGIVACILVIRNSFGKMLQEGQCTVTGMTQNRTISLEHSRKKINDKHEH